MQTQLGALCTAVGSTYAAVMGVGTSTDAVRLHNQEVMRRLLDAIATSGARAVPLPLEEGGKALPPGPRPILQPESPRAGSPRLGSRKAKEARESPRVGSPERKGSPETPRVLLAHTGGSVVLGGEEFAFDWRTVGTTKELRGVSEKQRMHTQARACAGAARSAPRHPLRHTSVTVHHTVSHQHPPPALAPPLATPQALPARHSCTAAVSRAALPNASSPF